MRVGSGAMLAQRLQQDISSLQRKQTAFRHTASQLHHRHPFRLLATGKTPLDESMQCKCRITIVTTVVARGSKAEQKKAARVAAMFQIQEQLKQQQAQKRATKPKQQQQQRQRQQQQQQQQQQWQPCPSAVAAVPQVPEALRARLAGPEQHEVPGMEFVSNKKPKAKKKGAAGGAGARAEAAQGVQAAGAARSSASTHNTAAAHVGGGGSRAELNSNNWVSR